MLSTPKHNRSNRVRKEPYRSRHLDDATERLNSDTRQMVCNKTVNKTRNQCKILHKQADDQRWILNDVIDHHLE